MPTNPMHSGMAPAEGARETIDREPARAAARGGEAVPHRRELAPGDEAAAGTPGTGEDVCPECQGTGKRGGNRCSNCNGAGRIVRGIGGA